MTPTQQNRDDLILQRLDQLHVELVEMRTQMKTDLREYVLKAVYDAEIINLKKTDQDQEDRLKELEDRVLTQGMRMIQILGTIVGALGGTLAILHMIRVIP